MRIRHLTRIVRAAAEGRKDRLRALYEAALADGVAAADLQEATLQVFLFAGFPRTIGAFEELGKVVDTPPPVEDPPPADLEERGLELFRRIYAGHADTVIAKLESLHPDFARMTLRGAYGRVLSRPFLDARERELMAVSMLAGLGLEAQLQAHVRGALRCGASPGEIRMAAENAPERQLDLVEAALASFAE